MTDTDSGGGILLGSTSRRNSQQRACSDVHLRAGSRVSIRSSKSSAGEGKLCGTEEIFHMKHQDKKRADHRSSQCFVATYTANSSRSLRLYCFLGFMVLKRGSLMTSGQTAGQGLPHRRLKKSKELSIVMKKYVKLQQKVLIHVKGSST